MVSSLASPLTAADMSNGHMAGLARSLTASQRVLTTLQDAHKSPKSSLGTDTGAGTETARPSGALMPKASHEHLRTGGI